MLAWICDHIHYEIWDETNLFHFNCAIVEVCEWINDFILHFIGHVITSRYWDLILVILLILVLEALMIAT